MRNARQPARINVKALVILATVVVLLTGGAAVAYKVRKRIIADRALAAGKAALESKDWPEACKQLKLYLSKYPDDQDMLARYAEANLHVRPREQKHFGSAIAAYRRLFRLKPDDHETFRQLAKLYFRVGDFNEVAYIARKWLDAHDQDPDALWHLGQALAARRDYDEADRTLRTLVEKEPDRVRAYVLLSELAQQQGQTPDAMTAEQWLNQCVEANPQSAAAKAHRARFRRLTLEDKAAAMEDLEEAGGLDVADPRVQMLLIREWIAWGDLNKAEALLDAVEQVDPSELDRWDIDPDTFALVKVTAAGELALLRRDGPGGVILADRALAELTGPRRLGLLPLAVKLYLAGGPDHVAAARQVVEEYQDALGKRSKSNPTLTENATILAAMVWGAEGKPHETINLLEPLVIQNPENPGAWRLLGDAYEKTGQTRRALQAQEEYLSRMPGDFAAALRLARGYSGLDLEKAAKYAKKAQDLGQDDLRAKLLLTEAQINDAIRQGRSEAIPALVEELKRLQESNPEVGRIYTLLAGIAAIENRPQDVIAQLEAGIAKSDQKATAAILLARHYETRDLPAKAIDAYRQAISSEPQWAKPRILLTELQLRRDQQEAARGTLEAAVADLSGDERLAAQTAMASFELKHGLRRDGIAFLKRLHDEHPDNVRLLVALLELPETQGDPKESQRLVDRLRGIEGDRGLWWRFQQARIWLRDDPWQERKQDITDMLAACLAADPAWTQPALVLGRVFESLREWDKAEETYRRLLDANPGALVVTDRLLILLEWQGRFAEAELLLPSGQSTAPALRKHRIRTAIGQKEYGAAITELEQAVAEDPKDADSRVALAWMLHRLRQDTDRALELLDEALAVSEKRFAIIDRKAAILRSADRNAEALEILNEQVGRHADFVAYMLRAKHHAILGEHALAEKDYSHLTTFKDEATDGYGLLGLYYVKQGRVEDGIAALEAGLELDPENAGLKSELIRILLTSEADKDQARARSLLQGLLADHPNDAGLLSLQATVLLAENNDEARREARRILARIVDAEPRAVEAYMQLIRLEYAAGDPDNAGELATRALGANPDNVPLLLAKADLEREQRRFAIARELARRAVALEPQNQDAQLTLVRILNETGERDQAVRQLEGFLQTEAGNRAIRARLALADLHRLGGDLTKAAARTEEAIKLDPDNEDAQVQHAVILQETGDRDQAIRDLESFVQSDAGSRAVKARLALVDFHRVNGGFAAAQARLDEVAAITRNSVLTFPAQAMLLAAQSDFDRLAELLTGHAADHPEDTTGLLKGARMLASSGTPAFLEKARSLVADVVKLNPDSIEARYVSAQLAYQCDDLNACEAAYREVLELDPDNSQALNDLAWITAMKRDDPQAALDLANRGVSKHPDDIHLLDTRGVILFTLNRLDEARVDLEKCLRLTESDQSPAMERTRAQALFHLGRLLAKQGKKPQAAEKLEAAMEINDRLGVFTNEEIAEIQELAPPVP